MGRKKEESLIFLYFTLRKNELEFSPTQSINQSNNLFTSICGMELRSFRQRVVSPTVCSPTNRVDSPTSYMSVRLRVKTCVTTVYSSTLYMRGRLGYPSDTCPFNNRSFAFNFTGRRGVLCDGRRSEKFTEPIVQFACVFCIINNQTVKNMLFLRTLC